jgi:hypothetical protein
MLCPSCHSHPTDSDPRWGVMICIICKKRQEKLKKPSSLPEFTTEDIKNQRKEFAEDIMIDHYKGHLNKAWVEKWGEGEAKKRGYSDKEIKEAQYTYDGSGEYYYNKKT